jgi:exonuclease III
MAVNKLTTVTILLWNANGISNNTNELQIALKENNVGVGVALISESHLAFSSKFKIFGYNYLQANHPDDLAHAGAALLISTKIPHSHFPPKSNQHMQIVATSININSISTSIASAYFPPGSPFSTQDLSLFLQTLNHTYVIGADFNTKHETWGCRS